jgi:hypothetical protein
MQPQILKICAQKGIDPEKIMRVEDPSITRSTKKVGMPKNLSGWVFVTTDKKDVRDALIADGYESRGYMTGTVCFKEFPTKEGK